MRGVYCTGNHSKVLATLEVLHVLLQSASTTANVCVCMPCSNVFSAEVYTHSLSVADRRFLSRAATKEREQCRGFGSGHADADSAKIPHSILAAHVAIVLQQLRARQPLVREVLDEPLHVCGVCALVNDGAERWIRRLGGRRHRASGALRRMRTREVDGVKDVALFPLERLLGDSPGAGCVLHPGKNGAVHFPDLGGIDRQWRAMFVVRLHDVQSARHEQMCCISTSIDLDSLVDGEQLLLAAGALTVVVIVVEGQLPARELVPVAGAAAVRRIEACTPGALAAATAARPTDAACHAACHAAAAGVGRRLGHWCFSAIQPSEGEYAVRLRPTFVSWLDHALAEGALPGWIGGEAVGAAVHPRIGACLAGRAGGRAQALEQSGDGALGLQELGHGLPLERSEHLCVGLELEAAEVLQVLCCAGNQPFLSVCVWMPKVGADNVSLTGALVWAGSWAFGASHAGEKLTCVHRDRLREDSERFTVHRARVGDVRAPGSLVEFGGVVGDSHSA